MKKDTPTVCPTCQFEGGEHQRDCEKNAEPWEKKFDQKFWYLENDNLHKPHGDGCQCRATLSIDIKSFIRSIRAEDERKVVEIIEQKCPTIERMTTIRGELWIKLPQLEDDDTELMILPMILPKSVLDIIKSHYNHE